MTLNQLLKQNQSFYGASVIAGEDCLDREVKSVMVLEAADIENWGKPGQLLLTSFYALQILDAENSRKFFINMQKIGICGIVLKLGRLISDIPPYIMDYCNYYHIPLITVPKTTQYETMILSIMEPLMRQMLRKQSTMQRYNDLVGDLLSGRMAERESIDQALHFLQIDSRPYYQMLLIQLPAFQSSILTDGPDAGEICFLIRRELDLQKFSYAYQQIHDRLVLLFNLPSGTSESDFLWLKELLDDMELPYQVTISNIDDRYHIEQLYHQTQDAHILANMLYTGNYLVTYDSLGFYKLFLDRNNLDRIDSLLTLQNKHLRKTQPELWKTLGCPLSPAGRIIPKRQSYCFCTQKQSNTGSASSGLCWIWISKTRSRYSVLCWIPACSGCKIIFIRRNKIMSPINLTAEAYTIPFQGHELHARVFRPAAPAIGRIFYLHGGGLVFGEPDDLPLCYVNLFLNAGYELISLDYPLAPEQRLAVILEAVHAGVMGMLEILEHGAGSADSSTETDSASGASHIPYYLFGRSAGAYLALMEAKRLCESGLALPAFSAFTAIIRLIFPNLKSPMPGLRNSLQFQNRPQTLWYRPDMDLMVPHLHS